MEALLTIAVVAGATGLVGQALVGQLADDGTWGEVRALVRDALPSHLAGPNVAAVEVDYTALDPPPAWAAADQVFCALGTTMRDAGSEAAFRRVDFEYPLALARAALARGARHYLLVSAVGAAAGSRVFYNRVKGEVEDAIMALGFRALTIARPSLLLGRRAKPRLAEQLGKIVGVLAPPRWRPVPAERVAAALVSAAKRDLPGVRILENPELLG
ncbi:MAG TPA: NAD(P)H-binding protein [Gemmatimonadales bacterium]